MSDRTVRNLRLDELFTFSKRLFLFKKSFRSFGISILHYTNVGGLCFWDNAESQTVWCTSMCPILLSNIDRMDDDKQTTGQSLTPLPILLRMSARPPTQTTQNRILWKSRQHTQISIVGDHRIASSVEQVQTRFGWRYLQCRGAPIPVPLFVHFKRHHGLTLRAH